MPIAIELGTVMKLRRMSLNELSERVGVTAVNLSRLKTGKAREVRLSTLEHICRELECQPGDILKYLSEEDFALLQQMRRAGSEHK